MIDNDSINRGPSGHFYQVKNSLLEQCTEPEKAMRFNEGKLKWSLVHFKSLEPMVQVLMAGAKKYSPHNWQKPMDREELLDSTMRHLAALMNQEADDEESKLSHAGHIMCNMMFYCFHFVIKK